MKKKKMKNARMNGDGQRLTASRLDYDEREELPGRINSSLFRAVRRKVGAGGETRKFWSILQALIIV